MSYPLDFTIERGDGCFSFFLTNRQRPAVHQGHNFIGLWEGCLLDYLRTPRKKRGPRNDVPLTAAQGVLES